MTVNLYWDDHLPSMSPGTPGPQRFATFNSLAEALEVAYADNGETATHVDNEDGTRAAERKDIERYIAKRAKVDEEREAALEAAHAAHADAVSALHG